MRIEKKREKRFIVDFFGIVYGVVVIAEFAWTSPFPVASAPRVYVYQPCVGLRSNTSIGPGGIGRAVLLRAYGRRKYGSLIQQNLDQINYLRELIEGDDELELTAPVIFNVVCFRFRPTHLDELETEKMNRLIMNEIN
jgi:hypothetical protein